MYVWRKWANENLIGKTYRQTENKGAVVSGAIKLSENSLQFNRTLNEIAKRFLWTFCYAMEIEILQHSHTFLKANVYEDR